MKKMLVLVAATLLAIPGITLADPTLDAVADPITLSLPGMSVDGDGHLQFDLTNPTHTSIIVDVVCTTASITSWGAAYTITSDLNGGGLKSGDANLIYHLTNAHIIGDMFPVTEYMSGVGLGAGGGGGATVAAVSAASTEQYMSFSTNYGPNTYTIAKHELLISGLVVGDYIEIILDSNAYGKVVYLADVVGGNVPWTQSAALGIDIVPEPATALLLLGAIPFLRRRR